MKIDGMYEPMDVVAQSGESLADVAARMRFNDVGSVIVIDHGELIGILTERDLARALADSTDRASVVADYMTPDPVYATPQTEMDEAARMMISAGFRHLPIIKRGRLVGVLSMRDILSSIAWSNGK
jgi:CBS domain-containing protein